MTNAAQPSPDEAMSRVHILLYDSDIQWLDQTFGRIMGRSHTVREIIRGYRKRLEKLTEEKLQEQEP